MGSRVDLQAKAQKLLDSSWLGFWLCRTGFFKSWQEVGVSSPRPQKYGIVPTDAFAKKTLVNCWDGWNGVIVQNLCIEVHYHTHKFVEYIHSPWNEHSIWKLFFGKRLSSSECPFSVTMLVLWSVYHIHPSAIHIGDLEQNVRVKGAISCKT